MKISLQRSHLVLLMLLVTIVPWLSGGREPMALFIDLGAVVLGLYALSRMQDTQPLRWSPAVWVFVAYVVWATASLTWSVNTYQTAMWVALLVLAAGVFTLARQLRQAEPSHQRLWGIGYVGIATAASLYGIVDYVAFSSFDRLTSLFYWPNPFAIFVLPVLILAGAYLAKLITTPKLKLKLAHRTYHYLGLAALLVINLTAILLTSSRTTALLLALVIVGSLIVYRSWRWLLATVIIIALSFGLASGVNYLRQHAFKVASAPTVTGRIAEAAQGSTTSGSDRLYYLKGSYQIWRDHPLTGSGAATFASEYPGYQQRAISGATSAHNTYAQQFAELGLVGGLLLIAFMLLALYQMGMAARKEPQLWPLVIGATVLIVHLGVDIDTTYGVLVALLATLYGFSYRQKTGFELPYGGGALTVVVLLALFQAYTAMHNNSLVQHAKGDLAWLKFDASAQSADAATTGPFPNPDNITQAGIAYFSGAQFSKKSSANLETAADRAQSAIAADPQDAQHHFLLARVRRAQNKVDEALKSYRQTLQLDPYNHPEYYSDTAELLIAANRPAEATTILNDGIRRFGDPATVTNRSFIPGFRQSLATLYFDRALIAHQQGDESAAITAIKQAQAVNPGDSRATQLGL